MNLRKEGKKGSDVKEGQEGEHPKWFRIELSILGRRSKTCIGGQKAERE